MLASVFCELSTARSEHGAARRPQIGQLRQDPSLGWRLDRNNESTVTKRIRGSDVKSGDCVRRDRICDNRENARLCRCAEIGEVPRKRLEKPQVL